VDDLQQLGVFVFVSNEATTRTTFCERGRPPASSPARAAASRAKAGGVTLFFSAQASRWASVWQQQSRQQCSAESQPQPHDSHGYRSLLVDGRPTIGSGIPAATTT